jgi:glycosyltransferase involved in cell wall biosynthesis
MARPKKMMIAILGTRGIPANYGGFETFAEELSAGLVQRGHDVTVYGRSHFIRHPGKTYRGARLVVLPTIRHKYLDTVANALICSVHAFFQKFDIVLYCNAANAIFTVIPRLSGKKIVLNVDGVERKRKKWNRLGKAYYLLSEYLATRLPHRIVTDAEVVRKYYIDRYGRESSFIAYGGDLQPADSRGALDRFGLEPGGYFLYVSRLEPENNAHQVIQAFEKVDTDRRLVIVGSAPYSKKYIARLHATEDPRIVFTGYVFGQGYRELQTHAFSYIHATEVGGSHPALLEAMGFGNCVIANDTPENAEVVGDCGLLYRAGDAADLQSKIEHLLSRPALIEKYGDRAAARIRARYSWASVTASYEKLFERLLSGKKSDDTA